MIVVDTDVIASFWIKSRRTEAAIHVRERDDRWIAPLLWRSEFRSVLRQYLVAGELGFADVAWLSDRAEHMMVGHEYLVTGLDVLRLVNEKHRFSYDCEFVSLARNKGVRLVTGDRKIVNCFPETAVLLEEYAGM